jgi:hypothetical protein
LNLAEYRLSQPTASEIAQARRVDLSTYRLKDHSTRDSQPADGTAEQENAAENTATSDHAQSAGARDSGNRSENEVSRILEIWNFLEQKYDMSQTPSLAAAFHALMSDEYREGKKGKRQKISA